MVTYSIVIPVYNAEKYLESCLESVLAQKSLSTYEVILVNDGSKDGSGEICDRYGVQYSFVHVIHQVNQGVSAARNAGIEAAKGQYVLFLDSDDLWKSNMLSTLDEVIVRSPDIVVVGYEELGESGTMDTDLPPVEVSGMTGEAYLAAHSRINCMPMVTCCTSAFRRELLIETDLRFPTAFSYGEDYYFHMRMLKCAQSVYSLRKPLYIYRENAQSITHTPTLKKTRDLLTMCAETYRLFPYPMLADYYCMNILELAKYSRKDAVQLQELLRKNSDILEHVSGRSPRIARTLYKLLGYYQAAKLVRFLLDSRDSNK